jgi:hypothetical protein
MRTLVLSGSYREAAAYARGVGLRHYRYASAAADVANFAAQRVVELPGYANRRDHHSIDALVKRLVKRGVEHIKDSYTPPPAEVTLEDKVTAADWLFAAVPAELAKMPAEIADLTAADIHHVTVTPTPSAAKPVSGKPASRKRSGNAAVPVAAESTDSPNDDPFGD